MANQLDYEWRLRILLAEKGIFNSKPLVALLAEHGIRLNLQMLIVLCKILDCTPNDLIRPVERSGQARLERRSAAQAGAGSVVPKRARIRGAKRDG